LRFGDEDKTGRDCRRAQHSHRVDGISGSYDGRSRDAVWRADEQALLAIVPARGSGGAGWCNLSVLSGSLPHQRAVHLLPERLDCGAGPKLVHTTLEFVRKLYSFAQKDSRS